MSFLKPKRPWGCAIATERGCSRGYSDAEIKPEEKVH